MTWVNITAEFCKKRGSLTDAAGSSLCEWCEMCNAVITAGSMERDRAGRDGGATLYIYVYSALV